jgi:hypothetical protein
MGMTCLTEGERMQGECHAGRMGCSLSSAKEEINARHNVEHCISCRIGLCRKENSGIIHSHPRKEGGGSHYPQTSCLHSLACKGLRCTGTWHCTQACLGEELAARQLQLHSQADLFVSMWQVRCGCSSADHCNLAHSRQCKLYPVTCQEDHIPHLKV